MFIYYFYRFRVRNRVRFWFSRFKVSLNTEVEITFEVDWITTVELLEKVEHILIQIPMYAESKKNEI